MQMPPNQAAAPMMGEASAVAPMADEPDAGYTICIRVEADKSIRVGIEQEPAGQTPQETEGEYANLKPAANIKDALTMALEIYKADGEQMEPDAGDEAFDQGFANRGGSNA